MQKLSGQPSRPSPSRLTALAISFGAGAIFPALIGGLSLMFAAFGPQMLFLTSLFLP